MRVNVVICDGCGKKIEKEIFGLILMEKNADLASGYNWDDPKLGGLDFCSECKEKIVKDIRKFAGQEQEFVELEPDPETDKIFEERQNVAEEKPDRKAEKECYRRMTIEELLLKGVPAGDIAKIKGCRKESVFACKSKMKKTGKEIPIEPMYDLEIVMELVRSAKENKQEAVKKTDKAAVEAPKSAAVERKTYNCAEVINTCENSSRLGGTVFCDYLDKHGKSRGCKPSECTVYVPKK